MGHRVPNTSNAPAARFWLGVAVFMAWEVAFASAAGAQDPPTPGEAPPRAGVTLELREPDDPDVRGGLYVDTQGGIAADVAAPPPAVEWMEQRVKAVEETLREARFRSALGIADQLRRHRAANPRQRVRLELVHATAALALGEEESSQASLVRLLEIDPGFELGEAHSPKLHRALERARGRRP